MANQFGAVARRSAVLMLTLACSATASALPLTFTKIADTRTASLSDPGVNFSGFGDPSISGGTVAFRGQTLGFRSVSPDNGIYSYNGGALRVVADRSSRLANPTSAFFDFGDPSISGRNIAFGARFAPNDQSLPTSGLVLANGTGIKSIVDLNTASLSDPSVNFSGFGNPSISGDTVAFRGQTPGFRSVSSDNGIYSYDGGSLHIVADRSSRLADPTSALFDFGDPSISGRNIAFGARFAPNDQSLITSGLLLANGTGIKSIVDLNTASLSDPSVNFSGFGNPSISGDTVAFRGQTPGFRSVSSDNGIYSYDGGSLHIVADRSSRLADPTGAFFDFGDPSISGDNIAFGARFAPNDQSALTSGLFVSIHGRVEEIVHAGEMLDGLLIGGLRFGRGGIDGNSLAFVADFTDGSTAVYRVDIGTVPEPGTYALLLTGLGLLGLVVRRGKHKQPA